MQVEPINVTATIAVVMGILVVLIPVAGLTLRFAMKPITESLARLREGTLEREKAQLLERRVALLEQELHGLDSIKENVASMLEAAEFQRQLNATTPRIER
ncbi:MAG TPA: hypothetical protein VF035_04890 [Longimicrobiales bacterium]